MISRLPQQISQPWAFVPMVSCAAWKLSSILSHGRINKDYEDTTASLSEVELMR